MAGRETADIVFCIDISGSMSPAIAGVKKNINKLIDSMQQSLQQKWDVRVDFLAHACTNHLHAWSTVRCKDGQETVDEVYNNKNNLQGGKLFTRDLDEFKRALDKLNTEGDEASIMALDTAADFPFRDAATCHRVIVFLTDEPVADGELSVESNEKILDLANKLQNKKIALYMTTPDCPTYDKLSQTDKCEWTVDQSRGLSGVDFTKLMQSIGKSVSMSQTQSILAEHNEPKPLFGQPSWTARHGEMRGL